jgi:hypothetical protein
MALKSESGIDYTYLTVKLVNGRFENWGAYTVEDISLAIKEAMSLPYVNGIVFSNNKDEADKRNRRSMLLLFIGQFSSRFARFGK